MFTISGGLNPRLKGLLSRSSFQSSKFNDWFFGPNITDPYHNVGRQVLELSLEWLSNDLLTRYCADKAANKTHANGSVAQAFIDAYSSVPYYTVQELEAMDLWTKLSVKAAKLGYCKPYRGLVGKGNNAPFE